MRRAAYPLAHKESDEHAGQTSSNKLKQAQTSSNKLNLYRGTPESARRRTPVLSAVTVVGVVAALCMLPRPPGDEDRQASGMADAQHSARARSAPSFDPPASIPQVVDASPVDHCSFDSEPPPVTVNWEGAVAGAGGVILPVGPLPVLEIHNVSDQDAFVAFDIAQAFSEQSSLSKIEVKAGQRSRVPVPLRSLPPNEEFRSEELVVKATITINDRAHTVYAPTMYHHEEPGSGFVLYDEVALAEHFFGGRKPSNAPELRAAATFAEEDDDDEGVDLGGFVRLQRTGPNNEDEPANLKVGRSDHGQGKPTRGLEEQSICVNLRVATTTDNLNTTQDHGSFIAWKARGIRMKVERKSGSNWVTHKNWTYADEDGCVESLTTHLGQMRVRVSSRGKPKDDWYVRVHASVSQGLISYTSQSWTANSASETVTFSSEYTLLRLYAYISHMLNHDFNGGLDGGTLHVQDYTKFTPSRPCSATSNSAACDGLDGGTLNIQIWRDGSTDHTRRKFVVAHEMGHILHRRAAYERGGEKGNNSCSLGGTNTCTTGSGHQLRSFERNSCAATEGFADFVATDVWNTHSTSASNPTAYYASNTTEVNAESGHSGYESKYCEDECSPSCASGRGVELDWLRAFWDFHTNNGSSATGDRQSHSDMLDAVIGDWGNSDAYDEIDDHLTGTDDNRWRQYGKHNGIDH